MQEIKEFSVKSSLARLSRRVWTTPIRPTISAEHMGLASGWNRQRNIATDDFPGRLCILKLLFQPNELCRTEQCLVGWLRIGQIIPASIRVCIEQKKFEVLAPLKGVISAGTRLDVGR